MRYSDRDALKLDLSGKQLGTVAAGLAAGAVMMYLFDPKRGAARRTMASDTLRRAGHEASETVRGAVQDLSYRGREATEAVRSRMHDLGDRGREATESVRSKLRDLGYRGSEAADSMRDKAQDFGYRGREAAESMRDKAQDLGYRGREAAESMRDQAQEWRDERYRHQSKSSYAQPLIEPPHARSDSRVDWRTDAHGDAVPTPPPPASAVSRLIPAALGAMVSPKAGGVAALVQALRDQTWNPRTRNSALLGGALAVYSLFAKRSPLTMGAGVIATALLAKGTKSAVAAANAAEHARSGTADTVHVEKTIRIDATPEQVFDLWSHYENFPRFMANVVEVRDLGSDLSHWTVRGPGGKNYEWDSILTEKERPHLLAWRSVPGAKVEQWGEVVLEPWRGGTRATVRMTYMPPAGKAGQAVATLLGSNPKQQLEEDLERLKRLLERGDVPLPVKAKSSFSSLWR